MDRRCGVEIANTDVIRRRPGLQTGNESMKSPKILIVEDESIVQFHLRRLVESMGYCVTGLAATADDALACIESELPDLVLMDIHLQGPRDGIETAREIRSKYEVAVVFVTAYADDKTVDRTEAVGAMGYIVKPFSGREVRAVIKTALGGHKRMQQVRDHARSLSTIIGSIGDAVFVLDHDHRITFTNQPAHNLTGLTADETDGRLITDVVCASGEDDNTFSRAIQHALETRTRHALSTMSILRPDGTDRSVEGQIEPLQDVDGSTPGLILSLRDLATRWNDAGQTSDEGSGGASEKMLIYSHDTFGLGHLRRCLNLSWALVHAHPNLSILLVTGSSVAHRFPLPPRVDYVKLPAVRKVANERYEPRSLSMSDEGVRNIRSNLLLRTIRDFGPDLLLVDHAPVGMKGEIRPALEWLHNNRSDCVKIVGLRDIIDEPQRVVEAWKSDGIYDVLQTLYDHVVIYGSQSVFDPVSAYRFPASIAERARFVNYVTESNAYSSEEPPKETVERARVVVTVGGGDGAVDLVIGNFFDMVEKHRSQIDFDTIILPGPLAPPEILETFHRRTTGLPITIEDFVESSSPFLRESDLVICTGGYNTTVQVLRHARRAIVIPRVMHRKEQLMRATRLSDMGLVELLQPDDVNPDRLFKMVTRQLASSERPLEDARRADMFRFDGAETMAEFCGTLMKPHAQSHGER